MKVFINQAIGMRTLTSVLQLITILHCSKLKKHLHFLDDLNQTAMVDKFADVDFNAKLQIIKT